MEKKQSDLCQDVLNRFFKAGILEDVILIGSWYVHPKDLGEFIKSRTNR